MMVVPDFGVDEISKQLALVDETLYAIQPHGIQGLERILGAGGKKLRPRLVIATAYHNSRPIDDVVITVATAIELVHLASLVHDDIMDEGTIRHGVATINATEGSENALLAGDLLLAKACALGANVSAAAAGLVAESIVSLCEGQAAEIADRFNVQRSVAAWEAAARGKTSSLFVTAVRLGSLLGDGDQLSKNALARFAESFGLAYQCADDIADFTKSVPGDKAASSDVAEGNYTLPIIFGLEGSDRHELERLLRATEISLPEVTLTLEKNGYMDRARQQVEHYGKAALTALHDTGNPELIKAFQPLLSVVS
ncbi:hypothetical protein E6P97_01315 [Patescibacteria group bacterium]|nr:MAG: hypothetical protein E6P97_01315 [Patescibacteria group bacterium]